MRDTDISRWKEDVVHIYFTNKRCNEHNIKMLNEISTSKITIISQDSAKDKITGSCSVPTFVNADIHSTRGLPSSLLLCEGARFMLTVNINVSLKSNNM